MLVLFGPCDILPGPVGTALALTSMLLLVLVAVAATSATASASTSAAPHIITIILDDVGWNDVGWRGGPMPTPTIDQLSARGVRLERHYVHPVCTPSRMSLLTGKYSHLRHAGRMRGQ